MTKKKKQTETNNSFPYSTELTGLLLILIGIIGFGFGLVGEFIKKFAMFLVGEWWPLILVFLIYLGVVILVKRKMPKFFTTKLVGFYLIAIVILVLSHYTFLKENTTFMDVFNATKDSYMGRIETITHTGNILNSGQSTISIGGGILGALIGGACNQLFSLIGTILVMVVVLIFGVVMLFNINLTDIFRKVKEFFMKKNDDNDDEEEIDEDSNIVITSSEEVKKSIEDVKPKEVSPSSLIEQPIIEPVINSSYKLPDINSILDEPKKNPKANSTDYVKANKSALEKVLSDFGVKGSVVEIHIGPAVTQYEVQIPTGTKLSRIVGLNREIALAMAATDVRIEAPIPGKSTVGIEIPNPVISAVRIKEILGHIPKAQEDAKLLVSLGKDIMGRVQTADISKMPHLLVAGSTGSGKSVCINSFIASILMRYRPDEVKLVMVDPKKVELSNYNGIPHLLAPVVTDPKKANIALQKIVVEMERRYDLFSEHQVKNITGYNEKIEKENNKSDVKKPKMPYIIVIIDELADLMLVAAKEVEDSIMRITQMARAAGIHLIVATQRPSTDVITGVVKANIPSRISFAVATGIDSRTILDQVGAEKLLGKGDMLYLPMGENAPIRIQGCFISDEEIERLISYVCKQQPANYDNSILEESPKDETSGGASIEEEEDPLYNEIVDFAISTGKISASLIQRRFRLGYNRAARVVDELEAKGIIGPANGSKPREVLIKMDNKSNDD